MQFVEYEQSIAAKERALTFEKAEYEIEVEKVGLEDKRLELTKRMRARLTDDKMDELQNAEDLEKFLHELDKDKVIRENEMVELKRIFEESREDRAFARELMLKRVEQRHELDMEAELHEHKLEMERKAHKLKLEKERKEADLEEQRLKARSAATSRVLILISRLFIAFSAFLSNDANRLSTSSELVMSIWL